MKHTHFICFVHILRSWICAFHHFYHVARCRPWSLLRSQRVSTRWVSWTPISPQQVDHVSGRQVTSPGRFPKNFHDVPSYKPPGRDFPATNLQVHRANFAIQLGPELTHWGEVNGAVLMEISMVFRSPKRVRPTAKFGGTLILENLHIVIVLVITVLELYNEYPDSYNIYPLFLTNHITIPLLHATVLHYSHHYSHHL